MVEGEGDTVVAEVGEHGERVGEPVVGEPVEAVAEAQPVHVGEPFRVGGARGPATGAPSARAAPVSPADATRADCSGTMPRMPATVARRAVVAPGSDTAAACARPTLLA